MGGDPQNREHHDPGASRPGRSGRRAWARVAATVVPVMRPLGPLYRLQASRSSARVSLGGRGAVWSAAARSAGGVESLASLSRAPDAPILPHTGQDFHALVLVSRWGGWRDADSGQPPAHHAPVRR